MKKVKSMKISSAIFIETINIYIKLCDLNLNQLKRQSWYSSRYGEACFIFT